MKRGNGLRCFSYENLINVRDEKFVVSVYCIVFDHSGVDENKIIVNQGIFDSNEKDYGSQAGEQYLNKEEKLNSEENLNSEESLNSLYCFNLNYECKLISGYRYYRTVINGVFHTVQITDCRNISNNKIY